MCAVKTLSKLWRSYYEQASFLGFDFAQPFTSANLICHRAQILLLRVFLCKSPTGYFENLVLKFRTKNLVLGGGAQGRIYLKLYYFFIYFFLSNVLKIHIMNLTIFIKSFFLIQGIR